MRGTPPHVSGMIDSIIVIGKPGSGKSILIWYLTSLLDEDGVVVHHVSDRLGLEYAVLKDTKKSIPSHDGTKVGPHSKLISDGPPGHRKVHILDGRLLNKVHEDNIKLLRRAKKTRDIYLVEYAIGPRIDFGKGKEALTQTADDFVKLLKKYRIIKRSFIIDAETPFYIRAAREAIRPDAMALETFQTYFPDGGEMTKYYTRILGDKYYQFKNQEEDHDGYFSEVKYLYEQRIRPYLIFSPINIQSSRITIRFDSENEKGGINVFKSRT